MVAALQHEPSDHERRAIDALAHVGDLVYTLQTAPTVRLEYLSPSAFEFLGFPDDAEDVDLACVLERIDPADRATVFAASSDDATFDTVQEVELRMTTRDGRTLWTSHRFRRVRRVDGSIALYGSARDVTAQHQAHVEHEQLQAQYRLLADNAMDIVCLAGPDRAVRWVSPSVTEAFGWQVSDLLGHELAEFVHPDDRRDTEQNRQRLYAGGAPGHPVHNYLLRVATKDGRYRWTSGRATPVFDDAGQLTGIVSGLRDVDELVASTQTAESERTKLRRILDSLLDPHAVLRCIRDDRGDVVDFEFVDANPAALAYFDADREAMTGLRLTWLNPRIDRSDLFRQMVDSVERDHPFVVDDAAIEVRPGDPIRYLDVRGVALDDEMSVVWHDNTERHAAAAALAESNALYHALAENASDIVAMGDNDGVLQWVSPSVTSLVGWQPQQLVGTPFADLIHHDDRSLVQVAHDSLTTGEAHQYEARLRTADGGFRWFSFRVRQVVGDDGITTGRVAGWHDIHAEVQAREELVATQQRLRHQATHDTLTGLANRRDLLVQARTMVKALEPHEYVAVLFIDVDRLKQINDTHGHAGGDEALVVLGSRIAERIRRGDVVARFGGDEFVVLLPGIRSADEATKVARSVLTAADTPVAFEGRQIGTTMSIGIALASRGDDPMAALRHADHAMYTAKKAGRNCYAVYPEGTAAS